MSQTLVRRGSLSGDRFHLEGPEAHHVVRVLRRKVGDEILLFDGVRRRCRGVIDAVDTEAPSADGRIVLDLPVSIERFRFHLFQGVPSGPKMDFVIEKAVELGAAAIVPFTSRKGQVKLDAKGAEAKAARWRRIAEAAAKQCERSDVPDIESARSLSAWADRLNGGPTFVFSLSPSARPLKEALHPSSFRHDSGIINLVIGPESGFSDDEEAELQAAGAIPVSLGQRILRTETAGLAALAILQHELNDA